MKCIKKDITRRSTNTDKMADEEDPLCCCEYYNIRKQRTHLLTFCCECDELDKTVDEWIKGNPQKLDRLTAVVESFTDRCRVPWFGGAKTFDFGSAFPPILLVASAYIACWHYVLTIVIFIAFPVMVIFFYVLTIKLKMKTRLFLSLSVSSTVGCYAVYLCYVAPFQEFRINATLTTGAIMTLLCFKYSRKKITSNHVNSSNPSSAFCDRCKQNVPFRGKHCRIDSCVGLHNHKFFLLTVFLYLANIIVGCYVTLLFECKWDIGSVPDCFMAYATYSSALVFVCCCYALIVGVALMMLLTQQIVLITFNITSYELRQMKYEASLWSSLMTSSYSKGFFGNWAEFIKS